MATGRDIARFVTNLTNQDYISLYDDGEKYDDEMKNEAKKNFFNLVERMNIVEKNKQKDLLD